MTCSLANIEIFRHHSQLESVVVKVPTRNNLSKFSIRTNLNLYPHSHPHALRRGLLLIPLNGKNKGKAIKVPDPSQERLDFKETLESRVTLISHDGSFRCDDKEIVTAFSRAVKKIHHPSPLSKDYRSLLRSLGLPEDQSFKVVRSWLAHYEVFSPSNGVMFYKWKLTHEYPPKPKVDKYCYKQISKAANTIDRQQKEIFNLKHKLEQMEDSIRRMRNREDTNSKLVRVRHPMDIANQKELSRLRNSQQPDSYYTRHISTDPYLGDPSPSPLSRYSANGIPSHDRGWPQCRIKNQPYDG